MSQESFGTSGQSPHTVQNKRCLGQREGKGSFIPIENLTEQEISWTEQRLEIKFELLTKRGVLDFIFIFTIRILCHLIPV